MRTAAIWSAYLFGFFLSAMVMVSLVTLEFMAALYWMFGVAVYFRLMIAVVDRMVQREAVCEQRMSPL